MSLIPAFEIGVLNAWILSLIFLFVWFVPPALLNLIYKGSLKRSAAAPTTKKIDRFITLVMILAFIYSVFLPLQLGTIWFYIGLPVFILGLIVLTVASVNFATTSLDELITKGLYHYSRHPMYLAMFLAFLGISIASASWVFLLLSIVFIILVNVSVVPEERFCLEQYGDSYREYMNRTPRWIGVPK